jgi:hypothetical protein
MKRRRGAIAIGSPIVAGGAVSNAASVVEGMSVVFHRCYEAALDHDEELAGAVEIAATLGSDGCVASAAPSCGAGLSDTLRDCVTRRVRGACFAAPATLPATVTIPASFQPLPTSYKPVTPF